jgi:hypothetical protein
MMTTLPMMNPAIPMTATTHPRSSLLKLRKNKKAHATLDRCLPTTRVLQKIPTTMHCILTIRDTLQTTVTVTAIMSLPLPTPPMTTTMKLTIRASLKQGELAIRASLVQGELPEHDAVNSLHQKFGAVLEHKTVNIELVMSDTDAALTQTSLKDGSNSYALQALERLPSDPYDSDRPPMLS